MSSYVAKLAEELGVDPEDVTLYAYQDEDGNWMIKAVVDAGPDPAAAQAKADLASALTPEALTTALELPPGAVQVVDPVTVEEAFVAAEGANAKNSVDLDFTVTENAFDPDAASGPTSAAGYAEALAAMMPGVSPEDIKVTAVKNADGTWSVTAEVDFGLDADGAQNTAESFTEASPADIAGILGLPPGSVTPKQPNPTPTPNPTPNPNPNP